MFSMDSRELKKLQQDLSKFIATAVPHATRDAINATAFLARKQWAAEDAKAFTLRNTWTIRQLRVEKASGVNVDTMQAVVGSLASYQAEREGEATKQKRGHIGVPIPTAAAAGQAAGKKRTRLITARNMLSAIKFAKRVSGGRDRKNAVAIAVARKSGSLVAYLELRRKRGIFRISPGKGQLRMLYDMTKGTVRIHARPTLALTLGVVGPLVPAVLQAALVGQLKRNKLLGF